MDNSTLRLTWHFTDRPMSVRVKWISLYFYFLAAKVFCTLEFQVNKMLHFTAQNFSIKVTILSQCYTADSNEFDLNEKILINLSKSCSFINLTNSSLAIDKVRVLIYAFSNVHLCIFQKSLALTLIANLDRKWKLFQRTCKKINVRFQSFALYSPND